VPDRFRPKLAGAVSGGFSLIELVISLGILAVGLVGAMRVFPLGLRASQRTEMSSRAAILAQRSLEGLKLKPWEELSAGESTQQEDEFEVTTRIEEVAAAGLTDPARLKLVVVSVQWQQSDRPRTLSFVTYLRREI
jgi:uncharacterized protein (TIGR02598 family)